MTTPTPPPRFTSVSPGAVRLPRHISGAFELTAYLQFGSDSLHVPTPGQLWRYVAIPSTR